jgi:hypothetical protein
MIGTFDCARIRLPLVEVRQRRLPLRGGPHLISLAGEHGLQHPRDLRLVVDDEDA